MTTRGSKLLDELNSASQSVSGTTEEEREGEKKRREGAKEERSKISGKARFEHNFSYGKVSSSVCPPTTKLGAGEKERRQVAGFSRFPSAFSNFCRPRGGIVETMGQTKPIPNRRNPPRFQTSDRTLPSLPPTNFRAKLSFRAPTRFENFPSPETKSDETRYTC